MRWLGVTFSWGASPNRMAIMLAGEFMPENKTASRTIHKGKTEHRGKTTGHTIAQDSKGRDVPSNYVRPKATQTPSKPEKKG